MAVWVNEWNISLICIITLRVNQHVWWCIVEFSQVKHEFEKKNPDILNLQKLEPYLFIENVLPVTCTCIDFPINKVSDWLLFNTNLAIDQPISKHLTEYPISRMSSDMDTNWPTFQYSILCGHEKLFMSHEGPGWLNEVGSWIT